ncbi:hypothetical protein CAOG_01284 [Capsaspora owczarzaki ATCC 30864]|uniref:Uncharacterized protein n=1 Tax=Capsaspora owczarzaki (strain ATCC 30864) TaxID=595528 RepID=A0A0D2X0Y5_CAPO3|nr:hypothetical protein CAOG_01284 [Capsaspora owczarzaki ATCC 30864]KJE89869.1 hypothetical protein, variant [Capsaspora owczarzaki ATCC 30864]|eukprot:XP_004349804.2 hypothetical protein CAOG_01284 [Capsaspora owczarzaki ATCC 30864]
MQRRMLHLGLAVFCLAMVTRLTYAQYISPAPVWTARGEQAGARFGSTLLIDDFDSDAQVDFVIGSPYFSPWYDHATKANDRTNEGDVTVFYGALQARQLIRDKWSNIPASFITNGIQGAYIVDASIPSAALISNTNVLVINLATNAVITASRAITAHFASLPAAFQSGIDTILDHPDGKLYLIKDTNVCTYTKSSLAFFGTDTVTAAFPGLSTYGFTTGLTAAFSNNVNQIYFFKGTRYLMWDFERSNVNTALPWPININATCSPFATAFPTGFRTAFTSVQVTAKWSTSTIPVQNIPFVYAFTADGYFSMAPSRFLTNCRFGGWAGNALASGKATSTSYSSLFLGAYGCANACIDNEGCLQFGRVWQFTGSARGLQFVAANNDQTTDSRGTRTSGTHVGTSLDVGMGRRTGAYQPVLTGGNLCSGDFAGSAYKYGSSFNLADASQQTKNVVLNTKMGLTVLARGEYTGDTYEDLVVSSIRGDASSTVNPFFAGTVFIYSGAVTITNANPVRRLEGTVFGAGFGHCLERADLNGDGRDDLVISAPFNDAGRVYVYLQAASTGIPTTATMFVSGQVTYEEFGFSVVRIGDLNNDGRDDVAIGAPMYNSHEGRIFLHFGAATGLNPTAAQIILGSSVFGSAYLSSPMQFGYSIVGRDLDSDSYPDLLVGAPKLDGVGGAVLLYSNNQADSSITLATTPSSTITSPGSFSAAFTVTNAGPNPAVAVTFTVDLSSASVINANPAVTGTLVSSSISGSQLLVELGDLPNGASRVITLNFGALDVTYLYPSSISLSAHLSQNNSSYDYVSSNNDVSATLSIATIADLMLQNAPVLVKNTAPFTATSIQQGQDIVIPLVRAINLGPATAFGTSIKFTLPYGVTVKSFNTTLGICIGVTSLDCNFGNLLVNQNVTIFNLVLATASFTSTAGVTITMQSSSTEPTPDTHSNTFVTNTVSVDSTSSDLATAALSVYPTAVEAGGNLLMFATFYCAGVRDADLAIATLTLGAGTNVTDVSLAGFAGNCSTATSGAFGAAVVTCWIRFFRAGASATVTVAADVSGLLLAGSSIASSANITSALHDPVMTDNFMAGPTISVSRLTKFSVTHVLDIFDVYSPPFYLNNLVNVTTTVLNEGPSPMLAPVVVYIILDPRLTFGDLLLDHGCTATLHAGANITVACSVPAFPVGNAIDLNTGFKISSATSTQMTVRSFVDVASQPAPLLLDVDFTVDLVTSLRLPDDVVGFFEVPQGSSFTITFGFNNVGHNDATNVVATLSLPSHVTFVQGTGTPYTAPCVLVGSDVQCPMGTHVRDSGSISSGQITLTSSTVGVYDFVLNSASDQTDNTDNRAYFSVSVREFSDIALSLSAPTLATKGGQLTYGVQVDNLGPGDAHDIEFTLAYDAAHLTIVSFNQNATYGCTESTPGSLLCPFGSLPPSGSITALAFVFAIAEGSPSSVTATGTLTQSVDEGTGDPLLNNVATRTTGLADPYVDFKLSMTFTPAVFIVEPGRRFVETLIISNDGVRADQPILSIESWPSGMIINSIDLASAAGNTSLLTGCPILNSTNPAPWNCTLPSQPARTNAFIVTATGSFLSSRDAINGLALLKARVSPLSINDIDPDNNAADGILEITVTVARATSDDDSSVAWWIILLACLGGVLVVSGAIFMLKKRGFFARKLPPPMLENSLED